ncbi:MAG TPA: Flp family type IVb pilin [Vicinamibacterales bacterium]|nr:Flp family type IVb pilin [Vicinamibacterales bacterium]
MFQLINRFVRDEQGQDLVEYAFLIVFIALVAVVGANQLGISLRNFYNAIGTAVTVTPTAPPTPGS